MRSKLLFLGMMLSFFSLHSQSLQWADGMGSDGLETGMAVTTDNFGHIYMAGAFNDTSNLDPNGGSATFISNGGFDSYVAQFDQNGNLNWAVQIGGAGSYDFILDVEADVYGNIYICGYYDSPSLDADPGLGVYNLPGGGTNGMVIKLDSNANFLWAKSIGSTGSDIAYDLKSISGGSDIIIGGSFSGTVDFDSSPSTFNLTAASTDGFVWILDAGGNFVWAMQIGDAVEVIETDPYGDYYLSGHFSGTTDLDPGLGIANYTANAGYDGFVVHLSATWQLYWALPFVGIGYVDLVDIAVDSTGDLLVTGTFYDAVEMDPANPGNHLFTGSGNDEIFIGKYNYSDGSYIWAKQIGGTGSDVPNSIAVDEHDFVYFSGTFDAPLDADPGPGSSPLTNNGFDDIILSRLKPDGSFMWAYGFGSTYTDAMNDIHFQSENTLLTCGQFTNTIDFDPLAGIDTLTTGSTGFYADAFLVKYNCSDPLYSTMVDSGCGSYQYTSSSGVIDITSSGTYMDTIYSYNCGCDSIISSQITIINIDTNVTLINGTFSSAQNGASYAWFDCIGASPIPGEINQSFTPVSNGSYGVLINYQGCLDTTGCHMIMDVGIENPDQLSCSIYPNPASNYLVINSTNSIQSFSIMDLSGKVILKKDQINSANLQVDISNLAEGNYMIELNVEKNKVIKKFIKMN